MTVRELINKLLDCDIDEEIKLQLPEEHESEHDGLCSGYLFDIQRVDTHYNYIVFTDWRKTADEKR